MLPKKQAHCQVEGGSLGVYVSVETGETRYPLLLRVVLLGTSSVEDVTN